MKYQDYKQAYIELRQGIIADMVHCLIKENALEIELHTGLIHNWIDDQQNEVIKRVNVETASVRIDNGLDGYSTELSELSVNELLAILEAVETGSYEVWEVFEK